VGQVGNSTGLHLCLRPPTAQDAFLESGGGTHSHNRVRSKREFEQLEGARNSAFLSGRKQLQRRRPPARRAMVALRRRGNAPIRISPFRPIRLAFVPTHGSGRLRSHTTNYNAPAQLDDCGRHVIVNGAITVSGGATTLPPGRRDLNYLKGGRIRRFSGGANLSRLLSYLLQYTVPRFSYSKLSVTGGSTTVEDAQRREN